MRSIFSFTLFPSLSFGRVFCQNLFLFLVFFRGWKLPRQICICPLFCAGRGLVSVGCVRRCSASLLTHTHRASLRSVCSMCEVFFYIFLFALLFSLGCFLSLYIDYFWVFVSPVHFIRMSKKSLKPATVSQKPYCIDTMDNGN